MSEESNELSTNTTNVATVRFDVGGTVYRVSRSLLAQYPDTTLSRMVSERWLRVQDAGGEGQHPRDNDEPIFIDRDGERFRYVLDYMRDGRWVSLPATVSKEGLLRDMEYFGFQNVNANKIIKRQATVMEYFEACEAMDTLENDMDKWFECSMLARYCFARVKCSKQLEVDFGLCRGQEDKPNPVLSEYDTWGKLYELERIANSVPDFEDMRLYFDRCLEPCGLRLKTADVDEVMRDGEVESQTTLTFEFISG